jgi:hypothetical protein
MASALWTATSPKAPIFITGVSRRAQPLDQIRFQNSILRIRATRDVIEIHNQGPTTEPIFLRLPQSKWKALAIAEDGSSAKDLALQRRTEDGAFGLNWEKTTAVRLIKSD